MTRALVVITAHGAFAEEFGGVEFPDGAISFADEVVSFDPNFSGGNVPSPEFADPQDALRAPDYPGGDFQPGAVSLGSGGRIILKFTNNLLTGSDNDDDDLHVFEIGSGVEDTFVDISKDGVTWHSLGKVSGSVSSIDLDAFGFTSSDEFRFVRLTDDPDEGGTSAGATVGADFDAVGAISTSQVIDNPGLMVETAILVKFQSALDSTYTIEKSTDLENWSEAIPEITGTGNVMKFFFEIKSPKEFYRLQPPSE